ncbi:MAG: gliding motility-associated C-terminal domain-containing protein [Bacteroidia bacterium]
MQYHLSAQIIPNDPPEKRLPDSTQHVSDPVICTGESAVINITANGSVKGSQKKVTYSLIYTNGSAVPGVNAVPGTGQNISFNVVPTVTTTYNILAVVDSNTTLRSVLTDDAVVTVNAPPIITSATADPTTLCGSGKVNYTATASAGIIKWYDQPAGGSSQGTGNFTKTISSTTSLYAEAFSGCASARTEVKVTVTAGPAVPVITASSTLICESGPLTLSATSSGAAVIHWSDGSTGATLNLTNVTTTTTYTAYATEGICTTAKASITITVNPKPTVGATSVDPPSLCGSGTVTFKATASAGDIKWYNAASGGAALSTGNTRPENINANKTLWAEANNNGCVSANRTSITATVTAGPSILTATATPNTFCGASNVDFKATATNGTITWYDNATGGNPMGGANFTKNIATTTTYYAEAVDNTCTSGRTAVTVTVTPSPTVSTASASPLTFCGAKDVDFKATASAGDIKWYNMATGGTVVGTNNFTQNISTSTIYYAEAVNNGCTSINRTAVSITSTATPTVNATVNPSGNCGPTSVSFSATSSAGSIKWYDQPTTGNMVHDGSSFNETVTSTKTYYAQANNNGCTSTRVATTITIKDLPTFSITASPSNICDAGQIILTANTTASNPIVTWYKKSDNQQLFVGNPYTYTLNSSTNYDIYAVVTANGCNSDPVNIKPQLTITPKITNYSPPTQICINTSATLTATASDGDVKWYNSITGGTALSTGTSFPTPALATNATFYVEASKNGCASSPRITVPVNVLDVKINNTTAASRCGGGVVTLSATSSTGNGTFKWYDAATNGNKVDEGATITPTILGSTDYYVSVTDNGCTSARVKVTAIINPLPQILTADDGKKCGPGTITLKATSTANSAINWYTTATSNAVIGIGNTYVTPTINQTTTYYAEAVLNGCISATRTPVTATINPIPQPPSAIGDEACGLSILHLHASTNPSNSKDTLKWYDASNKFIQKSPDLNILLNSIQSVTYYVNATSAQGCVSSPTPATATAKPVPAAPTTTSASRCDAGALTLSAAGSGTLKWYKNQNGGGFLQNGNSYTTPTLYLTTIYYVKAEDNGCLSPESAVTASINITPKISSTTPNYRCGEGKVLLRASSTVGDIKWYDAATNGTLLQTDDTLITPYLTNTTDYWVEANNKGCISSPRILVKATINAVPNSPIATGASHCGAGIVQLAATANAGDTINWYENSTSVVSLGQGSPFNTLNITATTNFYVSAKNGVCSSPRVIVTATINQIPTITSNTPGFVCDQGTVTLKAAANIGNINWYTVESGGLPVGNTPAYTTSTINDTTYYYVEAENKTCLSTPRIKVAANVYKSAKIITQPMNTTGCDGSTVTYEVAATGSKLAYQWQTETSPNTFTNIDDNATYVGTKTTKLAVKIATGLSKLNYKCIISSACNSATTNAASLIINNNAAILLQPISVSSCTGSNAVFKTAASGGSLDYQWKVDDGSGFKNIAAGAPYTGANTATLTVNNLTASLNGYKYCCYVSSVICNTNALSDLAVLTVNKIDIADAGKDQTLCIDTVLLKGSTPVNGIGTWTQVLGAGTITDKNSASTSVKGLITGRNVFVWEIKNGICSSKDTVVINTTAAVPIANAGLDQTICAKSAILTANAAPTGTLGQWRLVSGTGDIANKNNQSTSVTNLGLGNNIFIWKIENGACSSEDAVIIQVVTPPIANAGIDQKICAVTAEITANSPAPGKGKWTIISGGGILADSSKSTTTVTKLTEGKNLFVWTITLGSCSSSDSLLIDASMPPSKAIAGKDLNVCDDSTNLAATIPIVGKGLWTKISGPGIIIDPTLYNTKVKGLGTTISVFSWTVSKLNCGSSSDTVKIEYTTLSASVDAGKDQNICKDSAILIATSKFNGVGKWQLVNGKAIISQSISDTILVTGLSVGENKFIRLLNSNCGFAIDTVIVTRYENPTKSFAGNYEQTCSSELALSANTPLIGVGKWTLINGSGNFNDASIPNATISNLIPGNAVLRWTITSGACVASTSDVLIKRLSPDDINCLEYQVIIPTGFSPNGDGINDKLVIAGIEKYPGAIVRVYSYLGDLVYEKQDYQNDWDATGNVKGIIGSGKLPSGTYYLNVDLNNGRVTKTKFIVIKY